MGAAADWHKFLYTFCQANCLAVPSVAPLRETGIGLKSPPDVSAARSTPPLDNAKAHERQAEQTIDHNRMWSK
eukprot:CAMPEP_0176286060 /NCGR_PEP_ID=MMETSP0121_2-20121125/52701_1 /TAXON_ID=160619 /ORGANISM="Kryptoperidinium foliaceum, Strain CCMP 1326" /LENGTH=72 /DNA_ID=CAMNT_0017626585 /DNA_START=27 /DNA_END=242 /DNA_ORIENTATION=-